jgi:hypothetical protein
MRSIFYRRFQRPTILCFSNAIAAINHLNATLGQRSVQRVGVVAD